MILLRDEAGCAPTTGRAEAQSSKWSDPPPRAARLPPVGVLLHLTPMPLRDHATRVFTSATVMVVGGGGGWWWWWVVVVT